MLGSIKMTVWGAGTLSIGAGIAASVIVATPESLLRSSFIDAIDAAQNAPLTRAAARPPIAGTEDFWLSAIQADSGRPLTKTVSIGDRISMSFGGATRTLEVANVTEFTPQITKVDASQKPGHFVLVTAKDAGADQGAQPVRFVMEIEGASPAVPANGPRTL